MKGIEKLTSVRLAEVLAQQGTVPSEAITEALYAQDHLGEPFAEVLISGGHVGEWELAKLVAGHFQLPFITAGNYEIDQEAQRRIGMELLFKHTIVPLDVFGDAVTVVMPVLTPYEVLEEIQRQHSCELFPYVGLVSENKKVLEAAFPGYQEWVKSDRLQQDAGDKSPSGGETADWMNIFDDADAKVRGSILDH